MDSKEKEYQEKGTGFGGKFSQLPEGLRAKLSAPMPDKAIKPHPTKTFLSTIKAIYVVERLNDVFGLGGWELEHFIQKETEQYVSMGGRIYMRQYDLYTSFQFGGHTLTGKNTEPADGYKSAVTDVLSKCASLLEVGIQVFKGEPRSKTANVKKSVPAPPTPPPAPPKKASAKKQPAIKKAPATKKVATPKQEALAIAQGVVKQYVDAEELKKDAQKIVKDSKITSESEIMLLKDSINSWYQHLVEQDKVLKEYK